MTTTTGYTRNAAWFGDLVRELTRKELKVRYRNSFLGYVWSVASPAAQALVYFFAFKVIVRIEVEDYGLFLIAGLFTWQWFANSLTVCTGVFLNNASLIKKVAFPRQALPLSSVLNDAIHFALSLPVIAFVAALYGVWPQLSWLYGLPILVCLQFLFILGFGLLVSSVNLFFRDLERLVTILLSIVFYATPVIYRLDMVPERFRTLLFLNPMTPLVVNYQNLLLHGTFQWWMAGLSLAYGLLWLGIGWWVFSRLRWRFAEAL
jgi:lipopolysaccharide transport system permease protein